MPFLHFLPCGGEPHADPNPADADPLPPEVNRVARDTRLQRIGLVIALLGTRVRLRALATGRVWEADLADVHRVSARAELTIRLAAANARAQNRE